MSFILSIVAVIALISSGVVWEIYSTNRDKADFKADMVALKFVPATGFENPYIDREDANHVEFIAVVRGCNVKLERDRRTDDADLRVGGRKIEVFKVDGLVSTKGIETRDVDGPVNPVDASVVDAFLVDRYGDLGRPKCLQPVPAWAD